MSSNFQNITHSNASKFVRNRQWGFFSEPRILLPAKLREYAGLETDVVVIGSFDRAEIWNAARWAELESAALDTGDLEKAMEELGL